MIFTPSDDAADDLAAMKRFCVGLIDAKDLDTDAVVLSQILMRRGYHVRSKQSVWLCGLYCIYGNIPAALAAFRETRGFAERVFGPDDPNPAPWMQYDPARCVLDRLPMSKARRAANDGDPSNWCRFLSFGVERLLALIESAAHVEPMAASKAMVDALKDAMPGLIPTRRSPYERYAELRGHVARNGIPPKSVDRFMDLVARVMMVPMDRSSTGLADTPSYEDRLALIDPYHLARGNDATPDELRIVEFHAFLAIVAERGRRFIDLRTALLRFRDLHAFNQPDYVGRGIDAQARDVYAMRDDGVIHYDELRFLFDCREALPDAYRGELVGRLRPDQKLGRLYRELRIVALRDDTGRITHR